MFLRKNEEVYNPVSRFHQHKMNLTKVSQFINEIHQSKMENGQKVVSCIYVNGYSLGKITKKVARNVTER